MTAAIPSSSSDPRSAPGWQRARASDGTALAWRVDGGGGGVAIVLCNGIACSDHYWADVVPRLTDAHPVMRWDYRGHGRSGPPADPDRVGIDAVVEDVVTVLDAAGIDRAVLVGHSYGVQIALEATRSLGPRAAGVVAVAGAAEQSLRALGLEPSWMESLAAALTASAPMATRRAWRRLWRSPAIYWLARAVGGTSPEAPRPVLGEYFTHVSDIDLDVLVRMFASMERHSAADAVAALSVPLLVVAGDADRLTPLSAMRSLALAPPDGELVVVHGGSHTLPAEHPARVAGEIARLAARVGLEDADAPERSA